MPTYSYRCISCGYYHDGQIFSSYSNFKEFVCPECGKSVEQTFESIRWKINGWSTETAMKGDILYRDIGKDKMGKHYSYKK